MTLVDTSAWINFFRGHGELAEQVEELLSANEVALCGPVLTELRRGLRSVSERRRVLPLLGGCHTLPQPPSLWEDAGDLGFSLRRKGATIKTLDLLIASYALAFGVPLLSADTDFIAMRRAGVPLLLAQS